MAAMLIMAWTAAIAAVPEGTVVFRFDGTPGYDIDYRIPAITRVNAGPHAGRLIAVADYRYCKQDIGGGRIDLLMSYSDDNGATWSAPAPFLDAAGNPVAQGTGAPGDTITNLDCGFGDAAIVSDRETGEIMMLACCGRQNLFRSTRANPQPSARWWSKDGGETWTAPDYSLWEEIYGLFDGTIPEGKIDGQFIGSGRVMQSSRIKVGDHYRLYAVNSVQNNHGKTMRNYVLYSDDLGHSWHILGDPMKAPVPVDGDEPKAEELPDGSVLLAARGRRGGRHFNIFRYSDPVKAEGQWDDVVLTNMGLDGINACNGEVLIVPARSTENAEDCYLVLQSVPMSKGRENVGIFYKSLRSPSDYDSPSDFADGWEGSFQVSDTLSAYSTMIQQADGAIGFLYEEITKAGHPYSIVYKRLPIEEITGGRYSYIPEAPATELSFTAAPLPEGPFFNLTPRPASLVAGEGSFTLPAGMKISVKGLDKAMKAEVAAFVKDLNLSTGLKVKTTGSAKAPMVVAFDPEVAPEGYTLDVTASGIRIGASAPAGLFYAFQTVKKLLGPEVVLGKIAASTRSYSLPCLAIADQPRFGYRGFMLDVSRHFFTVDEVKKMLDMMSYYKLNKFHFHLTDDQGWRVQIDKYPKLTSVGATAPKVRLTDMHAKTQTWVNEPYGPFFYTKDELRDIVDYAAKRHIEVIPEIDMPGHFVAALCAYPEFSTDPAAKREVWSDGGISSDVLNVADPKAVEFAKDILAELMEIFPSRYIHIGGDECPTTAWEANAACQAVVDNENLSSYRQLQSRFTREMADFIKSNGRELLVWNEALTADGSDRDLIRDINPTIMCWVGADRAVNEATTLGLNAIYTPWGPYYINRTQGANEPPGAGYGVDDVRRTYTTVPFSTAAPGSDSLLRGVQGTFWTEHVSDPEYLEYLALPRLLAIAEAGWTPAELKNWPDFQRRITADAELFDLGGYAYTRFFMLPPAGTSVNTYDKGTSTK